MSDELQRDPDAENSKLFGGSLRLGEFSAEELSAHAGADLSRARTLLKREALLFERVKAAALPVEGRKGRPANRSCSLENIAKRSFAASP